MPRFVKQLAQARPANTDAATLYARPQGSTVYLDQLFICNTTGSAANASVFHDDNGTTRDQTTALRYAFAVAANTTQIMDLKAYMATVGGTIGIQSGTNSALTFTLYGEEDPT